jgi:CHC2 zinc finger
MTMLDPDLIERARAVDMLALVHKHSAKLAQQSKHEFVGPCPHCGGCSRFNVNPGKGVFLCRGCQAGGSGAIDLQMFLTGCDFRQAIEQLAVEPLPSADEARAAAAKRHAQKATQAGQVETARWLWEQRRAPQGTIVERYLAARGYTGMIPATIGYLPLRRGYPPSMIAAYAEPIELDGELRAPREDDVQAVHITRLLADGSDRRRDKDEKGRETGNKISIGAPLGFPIAIAAVTDGLSLVISEGIEDALAYRAAGFGAWAAGAAGYIEHLKIPPVLETLIIERHPDAASYAAVAKLRDAVSKWNFPPEVIIREAVS